MLVKYIKAIIAAIGVPFGMYLMALAYTTPLAGPALNNLAFILGF